MDWFKGSLDKIATRQSVGRVVLRDARETIRDWLADKRDAFNTLNEAIDQVVQEILTIAKSPKAASRKRRSGPEKP